MNDGIDECIKKIKQGDHDKKYFNQLLRELMKGTEVQILILEKFGLNYLIESTTNKNGSSINFFHLCQNICVDNDENQKKLFPEILSKIENFSWDIDTAKSALMFINVCTTPDRAMRKLLTIEKMIPFIMIWKSVNKENFDESFDLCICNVMTAVCVEAINYVITHEDLAYPILDILQDSCEQFPENIDHRAFIQKILDTIVIPDLKPTHTRSLLLTLLATLLIVSEDIKKIGLELNAVEVLKSMNKIDMNDPAILEWSVACLRHLTNFKDPDDTNILFRNPDTDVRPREPTPADEERELLNKLREKYTDDFF